MASAVSLRSGIDEKISASSVDATSMADSIPLVAGVSRSTETSDVTGSTFFTCSPGRESARAAESAHPWSRRRGCQGRRGRADARLWGRWLWARGVAGDG
eukprot:327996-Prymnesium_polylepis.2